ncbi:hypothetical protein J1N35_037986 [Gossypium stocksii]|uniref:Uncharacterized protein n=1 Tax=Gossypium stocksii TaxID=47602 RepID=A0A9D3UL13_9ROSI|nr:hypothetical protein J1N35_037986 [Gossypium stocksii]
MVLVSYDEKGGTKVLSAIQLAKDVLCGRNIDLIELCATKTPLEMIEAQKTYMKPVESLVALPAMKEVGCASNFVSEVVIPELARIPKVNSIFNVGMSKPSCVVKEIPIKGLN